MQIYRVLFDEEIHRIAHGKHREQNLHTTAKQINVLSFKQALVRLLRVLFAALNLCGLRQMLPAILPYIHYRYILAEFGIIGKLQL